MYKIKYFLLSGLATLLAGCVSSATVPVFADLGILDRVWVDAAGNYYSVVQASNGELTIHEPASGSFYNYTREQLLAPISRRPSHAPKIDRVNGKLLFGDKTLSLANVEMREIRFGNAGTDLYGILAIPDSEQPVPVVIDSHGSERSSAVEYGWSPAWYAEAGFATFIFDKRGTGRSGGEYTQDFDLLATDLQAAVSVVAAEPGIDPTLIGVGGYSQGVFVSTLAASREPAISFLIASFGVIESPLREDFLETRLHFEANYPELSWGEFEPLVLACEQAFALRQNEKWSEVSHLKRKWHDRIDADDLYGTMTGDGCLRWSPLVLRLLGRSQFPRGLDWSHDPKPLVEELEIPMIWQYGLADEDAPPETSISLLEEWIEQGKPIDLHTYADAEHGMYHTMINSSGESYRYKDPEYIRHLIDWLIEQRLTQETAGRALSTR